MPSTDDAPIKSAPQTRELACPLCGYNLRGLVEPRCPECGFTFKWDELIDAEKHRHNYLFEQGKGRNVSTFLKTHLFSNLTWKFWTDVNPAMPVHRKRLVLYWVLSSLILILTAGALPAGKVVEIAIDNCQERANYKPVPGRPGFVHWGNEIMTVGRLRHIHPYPWDDGFMDRVRYQFDWNYTKALGLRMTDFYWLGPAVVLAWPWMTLLTLLIFRVSMRQAKIKFDHVLRVVIYSCDYVLPLLLVGLFMQLMEPAPGVGRQVAAIVVACAIFTTVKAGFGFSRYLRVHLPMATVIASQVIVVMLAALWLILQTEIAKTLF